MADDGFTAIDALGLIDVAVDDPELVGALVEYVVRCDSRRQLDALAKRLGRDADAKRLSPTDLNVVRSIFAEARRAFDLCPSLVNGNG